MVEYGPAEVLIIQIKVHASIYQVRECEPVAYAFYFEVIEAVLLYLHGGQNHFLVCNFCHNIFYYKYIW